MLAAIAAAADALRGARRVVVFSGAGMSAESGIATFRDALTGLWARFDAAQLATPEAFAADPALVWGWYEWRRLAVLAARPNPGHAAVARLAGHVAQLTVITQNVDDLHERAGSAGVVHLHGSLHRPRCSVCHRPFVAPVGHPVATATAPAPAQGRLPPPVCASCGGRVRPGVVWFGEPLPERELAAAFAAAGQCDVLLAVGTSGLVHPAAQIPAHARAHGARVIEVNPVPVGGVADHLLAGGAGEVLPALVAAAYGAPSRLEPGVDPDAEPGSAPSVVG